MQQHNLIPMCVDFEAEYEGLQHALRYMYEQSSVAFVDSGIAQLVTIPMLANMLQAQGLAQRILSVLKERFQVLPMALPACHLLLLLSAPFTEWEAALAFTL